MKGKVEEIFKSQENYEKFVTEKKAVFDAFLNKLAMAIKKFIRVDDLIIKSDVQIVRAKRRIESLSQIRHGRYVEPIHYGYFGIDNYFFYTTMWASLMYTNNIFCSDCTIVDGLGAPIMRVGESGFYAGEFNTLNDSVDFEPPATGEIEYYAGNEFEDVLDSSDLINNNYSVGDDDSIDESSWLDDTPPPTDSSGSCSSCSSCSSCGGCT
jgi:hypothetical protein